MRLAFIIAIFGVIYGAVTDRANSISQIAEKSERRRNRKYCKVKNLEVKALYGKSTIRRRCRNPTSIAAAVYHSCSNNCKSTNGKAQLGPSSEVVPYLSKRLVNCAVF